MRIDSGLYNYYNPASLYIAIEASVVFTPNSQTRLLISNYLSLGRNRHETHFPTVRIEAQP